MPQYRFRVNGAQTTVDSWDPDQPLLYVLRNTLSLHAAEFGCGLGQCGACTVLLDGKAVRSCTTRFPEAPVVQLALIDRPSEPSYGAGEAAAAPVAAAIGNAVFDATSVRLRSAPFAAARVKAALSAAAAKA